MVYQLIYTSRTRASIDHHVMEQIAYLAAGRNAAANVTGMLVFSKNLILQVLEGSEEAVQSIYTSICRDTRHFEVHVLGERAVEGREFPDTPMGFKFVNCETKRGLMMALADDTPLDFAVSGQRMFA